MILGIFKVFATLLKDEVLNLVTFEEYLELIMVKMESSAYFTIIGIN
ncbi:hypothetical protein [Pedobacter sp. Leaf216]|nr:hypothetical protein [Pedobacter sp. Leaf216]